MSEHVYSDTISPSAHRTNVSRKSFQASIPNVAQRAESPAICEGVLFPPEMWYLVVLGCFAARKGRILSEPRLFLLFIGARKST